MILFHGVVIDLLSFNESSFGIFNDAERPALSDMFRGPCACTPTKFFSILSPEQKQCVVEWACSRSSFTVDELIGALVKFTKYLKKIKGSRYPLAESKKIKRLKK
jgi:hypothetical protein